MEIYYFRDPARGVSTICDGCGTPILLIKPPSCLSSLTRKVVPESSIYLLVMPAASSRLCGIICGRCPNRFGVKRKLGLALALGSADNLNFDHIATAHYFRAQLLQESVSFSIQHQIRPPVIAVFELLSSLSLFGRFRPV